MVDAVVLAGAPNTGTLHEVSPEPYEALIEIGGRPMLAYVLEALQASAQVGRLVVVGPPALDVVVTVTGAERVDPGPDVLANLLAGVDALGARGSSRHILVSTADIPCSPRRRLMTSSTGAGPWGTWTSTTLSSCGSGAKRSSPGWSGPTSGSRTAPSPVGTSSWSGPTRSSGPKGC